MKDGLSHRQVNAIAIDRRGFLWAGTANGLNCFDGYQFKVYEKGRNGVPFNYITGIEEDINGDLWVLGSANLDNNDLFIFDPTTKKATSFKDKTGYKDDVRFNFLQKLNDSTIFFGNTSETTFFIWQPAAGLKKIQYPVAMDVLITTTEHSSFWLQDTLGNVCEVDMTGKLLQKPRASRKLTADDQFKLRGSVYIPMEGQKITYKLASDVLIHDNVAEVIRYGRSFYTIDSIIYEGGCLLHPRKGLIRNFITEGYFNIKSLPGYMIMENSGRIWMANAYGLYLLTITKSKFRRYFYQDEKTFARNSYRNIVVDNNSVLALNEFSGLVGERIDSTKRNEIGVFPKLSSSNYALVKTRTGILLGMDNFKAYTYNRSNRSWKYEAIPQEKKKRNIWKIHQVSDDSFLLGTSNGLLWYNIKKQTFTPYTQYNKYAGLAHNIILDIVPDREGRTWICSNTGFYEWDHVEGILSGYSSAGTGVNYLPAMEYQHCWQDANGIYWLATANGLIRWDKTHHKYRLYTRADGLSNNNIYAVYEDNKGKLWLSSEFGLMSFDKKSGQVSTYLTDDGITHNEFNRASHSRDSAGNLYFGTLNGVTSFNPEQLTDNDNKESAQLSVSGVEQFNGKTNQLEDRTKEVVQSATVTLQPGDRFFDLNFTLLTFDDVIHTTYYWKIVGIDTGWNSIREPSLRVSGLPYGSWKLHIKAQAADGQWGRNELMLSVVVVKPIYLRTWFIILVSIFVVVLALIWNRWRLYGLQRENERLDKIVMEKTNALEGKIEELKQSSDQKDVLMKEIHHRVKNNLQVISTLLNLQLAKITDESVKLSLEEGISRIGSIALIHHHLYKGENLTAIEVSAFARELMQQVSAVYTRPEQNIVFQNDIPETLLDIDTALPIGLVLNELMTNSYKYAYDKAGNGYMNIRLVRECNVYILEYSDNGPGLPDNYDVQKIRSLGMILIKSLAKQLGGSFSYNRQTNKFIIVFMDAIARKNIA